jgi:hypothetical protein
VHSLLQRFTPGFKAQYRKSISAQVESVLARLGFCRTAPMGGRTFACETCDTKISLYNSCGDRHCPLCSGARRSDWLERTAALLLPGVTYFQVVFTLPDKLSGLILGNRRSLYAMLMREAAASLQHVVSSECGMQSASLMVLHTWNQRLEHHPHVHALVPGSGPSLDGMRWIAGRTTQRTRSQPVRPFLVDNKRLSAEFRSRFIRRLKSLYRRGSLRLGGSLSDLTGIAQWDAFIASLLVQDWCVFIEPPPTNESTPDQVLKYLARYMTGGPISDRRLVHSDEHGVTFRARAGSKQPSKQTLDVSMSGTEFMRRWALHILPKGLTKSRCYGGFSSRNRTAFLALCNRLKGSLAGALAPVETQQTRVVTERELPEHRVLCPTCEQAMPQVRHTHRPSWRDLMEAPDRQAPDHPEWYES